MSVATMTLIGMYNYMASSDSDLFLNLDLPEGIDKDTVVNNILLKGGEFETLYSNPYFLRDSLVVWSKKWYWTFDKWIKAINITYDPLYNYDRHEEWTESNSGTNAHNISSSNTTTNNITISDSSNNTVENKVSAFDSSDYQAHDKTDENGNNTSHNTGTIGNTSSAADNQTTANDISHNGHLYGNIGVTTSQQMLESEIDIARFNLYDQIADIFIREYALPIY